jgi:hypothetical protein
LIVQAALEQRQRFLGGAQLIAIHRIKQPYG